MEDCVRGFNEMNRKRKAHFDPYQSVLDWLKWLQKETASTETQTR
jgi:hypothetical protein